MIQISDVETFGFRKAIFSMRNPYISNERSDTITCKNCPNTGKEGLWR